MLLTGTTIPCGKYQGLGRSHQAPDFLPQDYDVTVFVDPNKIRTEWNLGKGHQTFTLSLRSLNFDQQNSPELANFFSVYVMLGFFRLPAGSGYHKDNDCQFSGSLFGQSFNIVYTWRPETKELIKTGIRHKNHLKFSSWREVLKLE